MTYWLVKWLPGDYFTVPGGNDTSAVFVRSVVGNYDVARGWFVIIAEIRC